MVYTFDMLDAGGRIDHVQLHHCESAVDALYLAEAALVQSFRAVCIEIWQGATKVASVQAPGGRAVNPI